MSMVVLRNRFKGFFSFFFQLLILTGFCNHLGCLSTAKHLERHYLLSGDADGAIILWELDLLSGKVILILSQMGPLFMGI